MIIAYQSSIIVLVSDKKNIYSFSHHYDPL